MSTDLVQGGGGGDNGLDMGREVEWKDRQGQRPASFRRRTAAQFFRTRFRASTLSAARVFPKTSTAARDHHEFIPSQLVFSALGFDTIHWLAITKEGFS